MQIYFWFWPVKLYPKSLLSVSLLCFKILQNVLFINWEVLLLSAGIPELAQQLFANPKTDSRQKQQWTIKAQPHRKNKSKYVTITLTVIKSEWIKASMCQTG